MIDEPFAQRVYWLVRQVPEGCVVTYGQVATWAGSPRAARAVGNLMKASLRNGEEVPWHRVINSQGGISGRGESGRAELQKRLLEGEGVDFGGQGACDLQVYRWEPREVFWDG